MLPDMGGRCLIVMRIMPFRAQALNKLRRVPKPDWNAFRTMAESKGYSGLPASPRLGSVITFDREGQAIVVATGASTAGAYVASMVMALQQAEAAVPPGHESM